MLLSIAMTAISFRSRRLLHLKSISNPKRIPLIAAALCLGLIPGFATGWVALQDLSPADYQSAFTRWTSPPYGLRLTCVSGYDLSAGPRYSALWVQQPGPGY